MESQSANRKKFVVVVAGGSGLRMGSDLPKQFLLLHGRPVLMWTLECFHSYDPHIELILVLPEAQVSFWQALCQEQNFNLVHRIALGGATRFHSVKSGLQLIGGEGLVAVHDGVRPLVSNETIASCYNQAEISGTAIPVLQANESLRKGTMESSVSVDRTVYFHVQTPQVFQLTLLQKAYAQEWKPTFTDDASVVEELGFAITMVQGNLENVKITHPSDLPVAEIFLQRMG